MFCKFAEDTRCGSARVLLFSLFGILDWAKFCYFQHQHHCTSAATICLHASYMLALWRTVQEHTAKTFDGVADETPISTD